MPKAKGRDHGLWKHGYAHKPEYNSWLHMMGRCYDSDNPGFKDYGGRGIVVCDRWHDRVLFFADMGSKPGPGYSAGRLDHDGNYEPANCEWQSATKQSRTRSRGVKLSLPEARKIRLLRMMGGYTYDKLAEEFGVSKSMISAVVTKSNWKE